MKPDKARRADFTRHELVQLIDRGRKLLRRGEGLDYQRRRR
jgi:hypothetical protein